jgi:hypothetical protein
LLGAPSVRKVPQRLCILNQILLYLDGVAVCYAVFAVFVAFSEVFEYFSKMWG